MAGRTPGAASRLLMRVTVPLARKASARRLAAGRPRSLWASTPILTLDLKARADRSLGFASRSLVFTTYYISKRFDLNLRYVQSAILRLPGPLADVAWTAVLCWAALRYDVVHCFYDRGLLPPHGRSGVSLDELAFFGSCGVRTYGFAYGADVRTRDTTLALGRWNFCSDCADPGLYCLCDEATGRPQLAALARAFTAALAMGDMLSYLPGSRNLHYWPIDLGAIPALPAPRSQGPLRIAHAPNHTHFKGSRYLEAAVESLKAEGHAIEYVKVQGVPNHEVLSLFAGVDLVADQFIGGAYGYTALEAMALGRPVLTFVRSQHLVEAADECPLIQATPDTLREVLLWILSNREALPAIGRQGRRYVERWHTIDAVAARFARLYRETAGFPEAMNRRLEAFERAEVHRIADIVIQDDWRHPFPVGVAAIEGAAGETGKG